MPGNKTTDQERKRTDVIPGDLQPSRTLLESVCLMRNSAKPVGAKSTETSTVVCQGGTYQQFSTAWARPAS